MRRTMIFSLQILKKNDEFILILVIYRKKTGLLHTKISNHNIMYSSFMFCSVIHNFGFKCNTIR